jgi:hypothetical protein
MYNSSILLAGDWASKPWYLYSSSEAVCGSAWCWRGLARHVTIRRSVKFRILYGYAFILRNLLCLSTFFLESRGMVVKFWWDVEEGVVEVMDMASVSQWRLCSWLVAMSPASLWMKTKGMKNAHISSEPSTNTEDSGDDAVRMSFEFLPSP